MSALIRQTWLLDQRGMPHAAGREHVVPTGEMHPAVRAALEQFRAGGGVGEAVRRSGYSQRAFTALFRRTLGLTPKRWCRLQRLKRVLVRPPLNGLHSTPWSTRSLRTCTSGTPPRP